MENRLITLVESRIHGDVYVRFGGEYLETCHSNMVRHRILSLQRDGRGIRKGNQIAKLFANNTVDVILYAVERTLDAYKFGLLHNKQLFIRQLKSNNMATRTIDEGTMDQDSGMNFSEYVAILSGNTDLLEKARVDKKITTLESERQAFLRGKSSSRYKLDEIVKTVERNDDRIDRIGRDLANFKSRVELNEEGGYKNPIQLDGIEGRDYNLIGKQLNYLAENERTGGEFRKIGTLYGFELLVKSETTEKEGMDIVQNRFYARGEGDYLYKYNNGIIGKDPRLASQNFIHALGTIEATLEHFQKQNETLSVDIPKLREVVEGTWRKEPELAALKSELREIEAKINHNLKPISESEGQADDAPVNRQDQSPVGQQQGPYVPNILRDIANQSDGRIVIAGAGGGPKSPEPTKGIKM